MDSRKIAILRQSGIPEDSIPDLIAGGNYLEHHQGIDLSDYWVETQFSNRDEFFVVLNAYFSLCGLVNKLEYYNEWRLKFDVAFLFQLKSNAQSAVSIDALVNKHCYADALSICRVMISRMHLLLICALNPNLFDPWLENPKSEIFLDGHIRSELEKNKIFLPDHLYDSFSEIIHNQEQILNEIGYFEKGLFPELKAVENHIWVSAKFIIAMKYYSMICMAIQDCEGKSIPKDLSTHEKFFGWLSSNYLIANRIDHIWTFMAEDRHVKKAGKDKYIIGGSFDFTKLKEQIQKFHRKGQRKTLSSKYNI